MSVYRSSLSLSSQIRSWILCVRAMGPDPLVVTSLLASIVVPLLLYPPGETSQGRLGKKLPTLLTIFAPPVTVQTIAQTITKDSGCWRG